MILTINIVQKETEVFRDVNCYWRFFEFSIAQRKGNYFRAGTDFNCWTGFFYFWPFLRFWNKRYQAAFFTQCLFFNGLIYINEWIKKSITTCCSVVPICHHIFFFIKEPHLKEHQTMKQQKAVVRMSYTVTSILW